ncbi:hypothetical protein CY35_07G066600 [Sphagnum magellanicum]|uniref:Uncharacterized protein n=3 Tax=Sphagnum magellanicum TaxID=128215 RepID=A0ACB8HLH3_9BRYO|nr:hypothetical protein CY35_07G066600 [Sphagnum magellanicum]KAH9557075.1 hypothetical protein CY35_07G066600 [Sphagnum magellanicum]KAH9557076.1 hypothetical protein CY35_07G066600 [Sphagnum magellanicum]
MTSSMEGSRLKLCFGWRFSGRKQFEQERDDEKDPSLRKGTFNGLTLSSFSELPGIRKFSLKELKLATLNFSFDNKLDYGGPLGVVYKAVLASGESVTVKRATRETQQSNQDFKNGEQILVFEYVANGSLADHICGGTGHALTWRERVHIALGASKGLEHLHDECTPSVVHGDIKPTNILLDHNYHTKITNFGLNGTHASRVLTGTSGYVDPSYFYNVNLGAHYDVYSFGVILLQLVTGKAASDSLREAAAYYITDWVHLKVESRKLEEILDPDLKSRTDNHETLLQVAKIGVHCTDRNIKQRPFISQVSQELELVLHMINELPTNPPSTSCSPRQESSSGGGTGPLSGSDFSLPELGGKDSHIKFDGMAWIDIKALDGGSLQDFCDNNLQDYE